MNTEEIAGSIETRLLALREEIASLQAAHAALHNGDHSAAAAESMRVANGAGTGPNDVEKPSTTRREVHSPSQTPRARVAAVRKPRRGRQPSSDVVRAERVERLLLEHGELSSAALAGLLDADRGQVLGLLRELEARGRVIRVGQRRGTRWRAITDEERIQQRAAELEALSRRRAAAETFAPAAISPSSPGAEPHESCAATRAGMVAIE